MAPYQENSVMAPSGDFSPPLAVGECCQGSPIPGGTPSDSPPAVTGHFPTIHGDAFISSPPHCYSQPVQIMANGQPVVSQPYVAPPGYMYLTHPAMVPQTGQYMSYPIATPIAAAPQPEPVYPQQQQPPSQGEFTPISVAIPTYEPTAPGTMQYIQQPVTTTTSPVQMIGAPVVTAPSPNTSEVNSTSSPPLQYIQAGTGYVAQQMPLFVSPPQQPQTAHIPQPAANMPSAREGQSISTQLEVVWHGTFQKLFDQFPIKWKLMPVQSIPDNMRTFMDSAKVRFICPHCQHCWTSMKGRVTFAYEIDNLQKEGLVVFRLYGQKCSKCNSPDYVHSMWYEEEVKKVIHNVHQHVGMTYYNARQARLFIERRKGRPSKPHDPSSCQACEEGVCREEKNYC